MFLKKIFGVIFMLGILLAIIHTSSLAGQLEKDELTFGFIKLADCAPVIIAKEKGFFEDEGLFVTLQAQPNWKVLLDRVIDGQLDGAPMSPGQAIGATAGLGAQADIVAPFAMGLNTLVVSVSDTGTTATDVGHSMTPPPQMPAPRETGTVSGSSVGEPSPEKIFGMRKDFTEKYPHTTVAIVKALLRAAMWLDENNGQNRQEAAKIFARPEYIGAGYDVIVGPVTGVYQHGKGDGSSHFNIYSQKDATCPYYSDAVRYLAQMRRWGQVPDVNPDRWYEETARKVYLPEIWLKAAKELIAEGKMSATDIPQTDGPQSLTGNFVDGIVYDGQKPNAYLVKFFMWNDN